MLSARAKALPVVRDLEHLALDRLEHAGSEHEIVPAHPRPVVEHDRSDAVVAHRRLPEGDHLSSEDVAFDGELSDLPKERPATLLVHRKHLEHDALVLAVRRRPTHQHDEPRRTVVDEEQPELHAGERLVRTDGQVHEVDGANPDAHPLRRVQHVGQGRVVALLPAEPDQLVRATLRGEPRRDRDLDVGVVPGLERFRQDRHHRRVGPDMAVDQRADGGDAVLPSDLPHLLHEPLERRTEPLDLVLGGLHPRRVASGRVVEPCNGTAPRSYRSGGTPIEDQEKEDHP